MKNFAKVIGSVLVIVAFAAGAVPTARAAEESTVFVVRFFPAEGREEEAQARLAKLARFVPANNPGVTFRLHRSIKSPVVFLLYETFPSQAAIDAQQKTVIPAFLKEFGASPEGLWSKPNEVEMYRTTVE